MSDISIRGDALQPSSTTGKLRGSGQDGKTEFITILKDKVNEINQLQLDADQAITKV
ncbi:MAG: hypothetical protein ACLP9S_01310 [Syntrophales bacterium]